METLLGRTVTLSALYAEGTLESASYSLHSSVTADELLYGSTHLQMFLSPNGQSQIFRIVGSDLHIVAAKLELGDTQTLAHQDDSGNWVLNDPPPDYGTELAKCQRYQLVIGGASMFSVGVGQAREVSAISINVPTPVSLRAKPEFSLVGDASSPIYRNRNDVLYGSGAGAAVECYSQNSVTLFCPTNGATVGTPYEMFVSAAAKIVLDANL